MILSSYQGYSRIQNHSPNSSSLCSWRSSPRPSERLQNADIFLCGTLLPHPMEFGSFSKASRPRSELVEGAEFNSSSLCLSSILFRLEQKSSHPSLHHLAMGLLLDLGCVSLGNSCDEPRVRGNPSSCR